MNLKQAQYIIAILEEGNITAAAQKLYISQPALSQAVKSIESEMGATIFVRGTNPMQLTYAGEKVVEAARRITVIEQNLKNELADINNNMSGIFRFGVPRGVWHSKGISYTLLPHVIPAFIKEYPQISFEIIQTGSHNIEKKLIDGLLDIGLVQIPPNNPMLEYMLMMTDTLIIITGKDSDFAKRHPDTNEVEFHEIANETFIAKSPGNRSRYMLDYLFEICGIKPKIMFEFEEFALAANVAAMCNCMMLFPQNFFNEDAEFHSMTRAYKIKGHDMSLNSYLCYHKDIHLTNYMRRFIEMMRKDISTIT